MSSANTTSERPLSTASAARPLSGKVTSGGRKHNYHPLNLMVVGHARTGKSTFIRTLVDSIRSNNPRSCRVSLASATNNNASTSNPGTPSASHSSLNGGSSAAAGGAAGSVAAAAPVITFALPPHDINAPAPTSIRLDFEDSGMGNRISLQLIDTPGLWIPSELMSRSILSPVYDKDVGAIANRWVEPIIAYIDKQYELTLIEESKVRRNPKSPDYQTHVVLYFLDPNVVLATGGLTSLDRHALRHLIQKANVLPCLGKSDLLTVRQRANAKKLVLEDLRTSGILSQIFGFQDADSLLPEQVDNEEDEETRALNEALRAMVPFALVNDEDLDVTPESSQAELQQFAAVTATPDHKTSALLPNLRKPGPLARLFPWGAIEVENPEHCEFVQLTEILFASHFDELRLRTRETFYETWRTERLLEVRNSHISRAVTSPVMTSPNRPSISSTGPTQTVKMRLEGNQVRYSASMQRREE